MVPKVSIVTNYKCSGPEERLDIIFTNFPNFIGIVDGYTEGLTHLIASERRYNKRIRTAIRGSEFRSQEIVILHVILPVKMS